MAARMSQNGSRHKTCSRASRSGRDENLRQWPLMPLAATESSSDAAATLSTFMVNDLPILHVSCKRLPIFKLLLFSKQMSRHLGRLIGGRFRLLPPKNARDAAHDAAQRWLSFGVRKKDFADPCPPVVPTLEQSEVFQGLHHSP